MRTRWIASLVSLSLASTHAARAQDALWFTPSQPTVVITEPTLEEQSFAERFGGLLSQPKTQSPKTQSTVAKPLISDAPKATFNKQPASISPASGQRSAGVREFEIPWSLTATAPFDFDQHAVSSNSHKVTTSANKHGAQVSPMAAQVRPNYVAAPAVTTAAPVSLPSTARIPLPATAVVVETVPWEKNALPSSKAPASLQAKTTPVSPTFPSELPPQSLPQPIASQPIASQPSAQTVSPPVKDPRPLALTSQPRPPAVPAAPAVQPASPAMLSDSLIVPIPEEILAQSIAGKLPTEGLDAPKSALSTLPPGSGRLASSQIHLAAPNQYNFVDDQPSASDKTGAAVVPSPPVTERLSDLSDKDVSRGQAAGVQDLTQETAKRAASEDTPLLTTESMIGPLKGAEELFHRLGQESDMRQTAARIESGPRGDASDYAWMPAAYAWISPALYHYPLYFEQPNLERYGIGSKPIIQPLASSIHFFGSIPLVPYKTLTHHPREKVYTLGNLRPGNCVPVQRGVILGQSTVGEVIMFWEECSGY